MNRLLGHRYSHETISAMTEEVLQAVEAFLRRPLPEEMAFVYLDGLYLKLLREGEGVVREVVYVALGVTPSGERQVLGYGLLPAESALGWEGVLGELWQRGLRRVLLFITEWQRCVVHGVRWSLGQVRARDRVLLAEDLRRVYGAESRGEALEALEALREAWGARYPGVVALWAGDSGAFLRFYGYPKALWPYVRSTNLMERFIREIRRGTKVRGQAEGLSCPQVSQRGGGVQAPVPGSRASARILCRRGKKGGGRSEGSRGSRWSSRDFCGFLFRGPKRAHVQVTPESPVLRGPQHHHRGQIHQAPLAGEDPNHPGPPLHLTDKPLQHIRALDVPLVAAGKVQVGQGFLQTLGKHLHRPPVPVPVTLNEPPGQRFRRAPPPRHKHLLELLGHHTPLRLRHMS
jgi:Transposase and inactivated derivatives